MPDDAYQAVDHLMRTGELDETGQEIWNELAQAQAEPEQRETRRTGASTADIISRVNQGRSAAA